MTSMSADEDTELRDLVAQTLENNGTLGKLRAQLRASVFLALEDQDNGQSKTPFLNKDLRNFLNTRDGKLAAGLVQEFLEFFNLEFTLAVFRPETGLSDSEKRSSLAKELNLPLPKGPASTPLLVSLLNEDKAAPHTSNGNGDGPISSNSPIAKDLTEKQIEDAREKFDFYDKDSNGSIDKDELRELFMDMFPHFHRNMLERYVTDEFNAVDTDFSSFETLFGRETTIDFDEFLSMYKRLFLLCRSVISGDVIDIVSPTHKPDTKKSQSQAKSSPASTPTNSAKSDLQQNGTKKQAARFNAGGDGSDLEEDPFFDDNPTSPVSFNTLSNASEYDVNPVTRKAASPYRPSQIPRFSRSELEKNKDKSEPKENGAESKAKASKPGSGLSSLDGLPSLTSGRGNGMGSLANAPPLGRPKSPADELDDNLRAIDKRMEDLGLDSHNEDFEYEDDFSEHSLSQKASKTDTKGENAENGSIAEEIDDEEIEDLSIEGDDLLRSEKSGCDDLTTDHSISQVDGGFDYMEDPVLP